MVSTDGGLTFEDGEDRGRIIVSSDATDGAYSVMAWTVAPAVEATNLGFGPHRHNGIDETFLVQSGQLEFLLGEDVSLLSAGDFVRVPAGTRHGYRNCSGTPVDLVVTFVPGGFEELFVTHRTDQEPAPDSAGFVADATRNFDSSFE